MASVPGALGGFSSRCPHRRSFPGSAHPSESRLQITNASATRDETMWP